MEYLAGIDFFQNRVDILMKVEADLKAEVASLKAERDILEETVASVKEKNKDLQFDVKEKDGKLETANIQLMVLRLKVNEGRILS
jgi:hypothetical protein